MGNYWATRVALSFCYLVVAFLISLASSFFLGLFLWLTYNIFLIDFCGNKPMSYMHAVALVFVFDLLMTPSAVLGMRLMSSAAKGNENNQNDSNSEAGV